MKTIGELIYWVESSTRYGKLIPCPMCFGKFFVTITLGDGSQCEVECGMCAHGFERPSGKAQVWEPSAILMSGVIDGVSTRGEITYQVGYHTVKASEAFSNQAEAMVHRDIKQKEVEELAQKYYATSFVDMKKKQVWSAGYHRARLKEHERSADWHKMRLNMIKERENGKAK